MSVLLRGMTWEHPRGFGSATAAAARWAELRPGVAVEWEQRSLQAFATEPLPGLAERYDLLVIDHPHIALAAQQQILLPLQGRGYDADLEALAGRSVGASYASYHHRGDQLALPVDAAAQVAAHRPDLLPVPPASWSEVLELAGDGAVLWPAGPVDAWSSLLTLCVNLGGRPMQEHRFVDRAVLAEALDLLRRLLAAVPEDVLGMNPIQVAEALATGSRWAYCPLLYGYTNYARDGFRPHRLRYCDMPGVAAGGSLLGGAGVAVSARSAHPGEAVEHAFWLASGPVQRGVWFEGGGQPAHADAWDDPALDAATLGFFSGTRATLESAWVRPAHPGFTALQDASAPLVTAHLAGRLDEAELAARLDRETALMWQGGQMQEAVDAGR